MHFNKISAVVVALVAAAAPALATDYRQLYNFDGENGAAFCRGWKCACINYVPKTASLYFSGAVCEPGNYQGENMDSQARAFCLFTDGKTNKTINKHISSALGARLASD